MAVAELYLNEAFVTVCYSMLLGKLRKYGLRKRPVRWTAKRLGPEACDQWQDERPWAQVKTHGIPWPKKASLLQREGAQRVEEVVESPSWEVLKTRLAGGPGEPALAGPA